MCFCSSVLATSKGKIQNFVFPVSVPLLWDLMCSKNEGTIKELLVLQFADLRSINKELLELGLEVGSLYKKSVYCCCFTD